MRHLRWFVISILFVVVPDAMAQISPCTGAPLPGSHGPWLQFNPPAPNSAQLVAITVGESSYIPVGTPPQVQLQGNIINVTFAANFLGILPPPPACGTAFVGPLAQGVYTVNLYVLDRNLGGPVPFLAGTTSLAVLAGPEPSLPITPVVGLWWNPAESGTGYSLDYKHGVLVVTVYSYTTSGSPIWYLASGPVTNNTFSATLDRYLNGQCIFCTYRAPTMGGNDGAIGITFTSPTTAIITLPGGRNFQIVPQAF